MKLPDRTDARHLALGLALLASGCSLAAAAPPAREFTLAAAAIYARTQALRHQEKAMLANTGNAGRLAIYQQRREATRGRIEQLMNEARAAASSDGDRRRLDQLAAYTSLADARFEQLRTASAGRQQPLPLAGLAE